MVCVNDLKKLKCNKREILKELVILVAPFAPHICEELWYKLGYKASVSAAIFPTFDESHLTEDSIEYPISINGKKRGTAEFASTASKEDIEALVLDLELTKKWSEGKQIRKVIVVPKRMVNIVVG